MSDTSIQWTNKTWNPVRGCSVISPGCANCYAMKQAHRFSGNGKAFEGLTKQTKAGPQWTGAVRLAEKQLLEPLSWREPQKVFVNSMSDLFHESMQDEWIDRVFAVMALAKQHTFQILTKRADRMGGYMADAGLSKRIAERMLAEHTRSLIKRREIMPGNGFALNGLRPLLSRGVEVHWHHAQDAASEASMMQLGFIGFGPLRAIVGRRRWYCPTSGKAAEGRAWRDRVRCPQCGVQVCITSLRKFPNHGRAAVADGRPWR